MADIIAWSAYQNVRRGPNRRFAWDWYDTHLLGPDSRAVLAIWWSEMIRCVGVDLLDQCGAAQNGNRLAAVGAAACSGSQPIADGR
jgi:hypothetical protein